MSSLLSSSLAESSRARSDLTEQDPEGYPLFMTNFVGLDVEVTNIKGYKRFLNDTFIVSSFSHPNSIIYDADEAFIHEECEDYTDWVSAGTDTITFSNDSTSGHFWIGTQGINFAWSVVSDSLIGAIFSSSVDFSPVVGVSAGTPSQGTMGFWLHSADYSDFEIEEIYIGTDSENYFVYTPTKLHPSEDGVRVLYQIDMDNPVEEEGTTDWTDIGVFVISIISKAAGSFTIDYVTASKSDDISLCGLGDRRISILQFSKDF